MTIVGPIEVFMTRDHARLDRLLVDKGPLSVLCERLGRLNALEEGPGGLYAACDALAGDRSESVLRRLHAQPTVPLALYCDARERGLR